MNIPPRAVGTATRGRTVALVYGDARSKKVTPLLEAMLRETSAP